ncbi:MAG: hypothetical protein GXP09_03875 [Gammaproteobacteria bacterium]|nr:hypothetical protein [Gammaproteobacteria bacterium]
MTANIVAELNGAPLYVVGAPHLDKCFVWIQDFGSGEIILSASGSIRYEGNDGARISWKDRTLNIGDEVVFIIQKGVKQTKPDEVIPAIFPRTVKEFEELEKSWESASNSDDNPQISINNEVLRAICQLSVSINAKKALFVGDDDTSELFFEIRSGSFRQDQGKACATLNLGYLHNGSDINQATVPTTIQLNEGDKVSVNINAVPLL